MCKTLKDKKLFILDASGFIFRSYFALPTMISPVGDVVQGVFGFVRSFNKLRKDFDLIHVVAVFDGPNNKESRKAIYGGYKSNRTRKFEDLPKQISFIKEFCCLIGLPYIEIDGVEADDVIGSIAIFAEKKNFEVYICSADKDLCQLVNENIYILNPWKNNLILDREGVKSLYGVYPENIADYLALVGDSVDNIPGVKGCGPKSAVQLLERFGSVEDLLISLDCVEQSKQIQTIKNSQEILQIGKKLATIDRHVSFPFSSNTFEFSYPDQQEDSLCDFYEKLGFISLIKKEKNIPVLEENELKLYKKISSLDELNQLKESFVKAEIFSFIFHYEGNSSYNLDILGLCLCFEKGQTVYISKETFNENYSFREFVDNILLSKKLIGFSTKNDLHAFRTISQKDFVIYFDIAIASYLLHTGDRELSLQELAKIYLESSDIKHFLSYKSYRRDSLLIKEQYSYQFFCEIAEINFLLYPILERNLKERSLINLFESIEMPLIYSLFSMERAGVFVNVPELNILEEHLKEKLKQIEQNIYELARESFNINSSKQLANILFNVLKLPSFGDKLSTKAEVLEALLNHHPIISEILSYRMLEKLRSTYVAALPKQVDTKTQRIHPTFIQTLTATGRLACQSPNLQNIPIKTEMGLAIRHTFCPQTPDRNFVSFDYSQIELRFLAHFSNDERMIEAFFLNQDIHSVTASEIFQVPLSEVTKEQRRQAKAVNFGLIYGQQAYGLSKILKISLQRSKELIASYFSRYPSINDYLEQVIEKAMVEGKIKTLLGRERKINGLHSQNALERNAARRLAINTPMQGSAADLIKLAMVEIHKLFLKERLRSYMILQIHDELLFEIFPEEEDFLISEIKKIMETSITLRVPLVANISIGKNWAEC